MILMHFFTIQLSSTIFYSKVYINMTWSLYDSILKFDRLNWRALYHLYPNLFKIMYFL
jgi:hypothetical protein